MKKKQVIILVIMVLCLGVMKPSSARDEAARYIGSIRCMECHQDEYRRYLAHSKKSRAFKSVIKMQKGLTKRELITCYECHTTGYGQGGFSSYEKTPELAGVGCEACHGPGSLHAATENPEAIKRKVEIKTCKRCHIEQRIKAFRYKPLIFAGAH